MNIKHSKYKNTGLIFELLVKQVTADTLAKKDSPALSIIKKHFTGNSSLVKEFKLYEFIANSTNLPQQKADAILSTITELSRKLDQKTLKTQKYNLIADIKEAYDLNEFFGIQVKEYKPLAALYCLMEAQNSPNLVDPQFLINNKITLLEHLTSNPQSSADVKDSLVEEYSKYDEDLRFLTFKILLEKFNNKYKDLLPEQKNILREFIISPNSTAKLRTIINEEFDKVQEKLIKLREKVKDGVTRIKLEEVLRGLKPLVKTEKIVDSHLVSLMQYYELINELKSL